MRWSLTIMLLLCLGGCDRSTAPADTGAVTEVEGTVPSRWVSGEGGAVTAGDADETLAAAMDEARSTADEARRDWAVTPIERRSAWGVKWAARTIDGRVEYVWVEPQTWSAFRIEGILVNEPVRGLECGRGLGERVSFPVEEMADWVFLLAGSFEGPRRGGYTLDLMEMQYGDPGN